MFIGAVTTFHEPTVAMRFDMKPPAAKDEEDDADENSLADPTLSPRRIAAMRDYWKVGSRWLALGTASEGFYTG